MSRKPMSARDVLAVMIRTDRGSMTVWSPEEAQEAIDAHRAEVLRNAAREARRLERHRYSAEEVARHLDLMASAAHPGEQETRAPYTPSTVRTAAVAEYLYCGADLVDRAEFPFTCYRRIGHDGACGPTTDVDAADREADRG